MQQCGLVRMGVLGVVYSGGELGDGDSLGFWWV